MSRHDSHAARGHGHAWTNPPRALVQFLVGLALRERHIRSAMDHRLRLVKDIPDGTRS
ncbi:MAG: hypothetical protein ACREGL_02335 [Alphaproteobacteria bacterium]